MYTDVLFLFLGVAGLFYGGEWLVRGSSRIALAYQVSPLFIGMTIVAVGTSVPELVVSLLAAFADSPGLALGNVIGSNIANIGLILGLTGSLRVLTVEPHLIKREIPIMILITIFASLLILDGYLNRLDGILLLFGFVSFTGIFYKIAKNEGREDEVAADLELPDHPGERIYAINRLAEFGRVLFGSVVLIIGARLMVTGAQNIAVAVGVSDLVIGVTIVAIGTSLPELATSLTAALKGENDIAIGNVIGSNIANLLLILGSTSTVVTIDVGKTDLSIVEYLVMLGFSLILLPFARNKELSRIESAILLGAYLAFVFYSFFS